MSFRRVSADFTRSDGRPIPFFGVVHADEWEELGLPRLKPAARSVWHLLRSCVCHKGLTVGFVAKKIWGKGRFKTSAIRALEQLQKAGLAKYSTEGNGKNRAQYWYAVMPDIEVVEGHPNHTGNGSELHRKDGSLHRKRCDSEAAKVNRTGNGAELHRKRCDQNGLTESKVHRKRFADRTGNGSLTAPFPVRNHTGNGAHIREMNRLREHHQLQERDEGEFEASRRNRKTDPRAIVEKSVERQVKAMIAGKAVEDVDFSDISAEEELDSAKAGEILTKAASSLKTCWRERWKQYQPVLTASLETHGNELFAAALVIAEAWEDARARNAKKAGVPVSKARVASGFWAKLVKQHLTTHRGLLSVRLQELSERVEAEELEAAEKRAREQVALRRAQPPSTKLDHPGLSLLDWFERTHETLSQRLELAIACDSVDKWVAAAVRKLGKLKHDFLKDEPRASRNALTKGRQREKWVIEVQKLLKNFDDAREDERSFQREHGPRQGVPQ